MNAVEMNEAVRSTLSDNGETISLSLRDPALELKAKDLDVLIALLGHYRAQMKPAIPVDQAAAQWAQYADHVQVLHIQKDGKTMPIETGALFLFQNPRFGWFQFPATAEFCRGLIPWLQGKGDELNAPSGTTLQ
jgi:hypothetical protein